MDTILSKIVVESMVLSGRVKGAEQGRSGKPFKRNNRNCSVDESSPNVVLGSTPSKESTSERRCDGYMDLAGCSLWEHQQNSPQPHFPSLRPSPVENKSMEYSALDCFGLLGVISAVLVARMKVSL